MLPPKGRQEYCEPRTPGTQIDEKTDSLMPTDRRSASVARRQRQKGLIDYLQIQKRHRENCAAKKGEEKTEGVQQQEEER
jgi:hypothetical protein